MAIEQIKLIKEAEAKAEEIRKASAAECKQMLADAERDAAKQVEQARMEAEDTYREILAKAEAEAQIGFNVIIDKAEAECDALSLRAEKNLDSAVSMIVGRIVK